MNQGLYKNLQQFYIITALLINYYYHDLTVIQKLTLSKFSTYQLSCRSNSLYFVRWYLIINCVKIDVQVNLLNACTKRQSQMAVLERCQ